MPGIQIAPCRKNLRHFHIIIDGPVDTPYAGARSYRTLNDSLVLHALSTYCKSAIALRLVNMADAAGGVFKLEVVLYEDYPSCPLQVLQSYSKFVTTPVQRAVAKLPHIIKQIMCVNPCIAGKHIFQPSIALF